MTAAALPPVNPRPCDNCGHDWVLHQYDGGIPGAATPCLERDCRCQQFSALPTPDDLTDERLANADALLTRLASARAIQWPWPKLNDLMGPLLPRDFIVVGSRPGGGKTALALNALDHWCMASVATLYFPLELDPEIMALKWAALRLRFDAAHVLRGEWGKLPAGAEAAVRQMVKDQKAAPHIQFAPLSKLTTTTLRRWCQWAQDRIGARLVVVDHIHRMDSGGAAADRRVSTTDMVRTLKDAARELDLTVVVTAQLNRSSDPLDAYIPPVAARLKETAAIEEEADQILMLSRALKRDLPDKAKQKLQLGQFSEQDVAEPNTMLVTCRKHRLAPDALNKRVRLHIADGVIS